MKKRTVYRCVLAVVILFLPTSDLFADAHKTTEMNRKIDEISTLRENITAKIVKAQEMRAQLNDQLRELKSEIIQEQARLNISSYQQAARNLRINYDLKLIQRLSAYIARLDERIFYFENADETLDYYFKRLKDDLLMIKTLNDLEVDRLVTEINLVLDEYIPEIRGPMISVENIPMENTENIWHEIIAKPKTTYSAK